MTDHKPIALTLGDPAGIGPEIALMAWRERDVGPGLPPFFLIGDSDFVERRASELGFSIPVAEVGPDYATEVFPRALPVMPLPSGMRIGAVAGRPDSANAGATLESITTGVSLVRAGTAAALVTSDRRVLSHRLAGQEAAHAPFGGVVPEIAARAHVEALEPLVHDLGGDLLTKRRGRGAGAR